MHRDLLKFCSVVYFFHSRGSRILHAAMEVLGGVEACCALTELTIKIIVFLKKVHEAPEILQKYIQRLESIQEVTGSIQNAGALQLAPIECALVSCLRTISSISDSLEKLQPPDDASSIQKWTRQVLTVLKRNDLKAKFDEIGHHQTDIITALTASSAKEISKLPELIDTVKRIEINTISKQASTDLTKTCWMVPQVHTGRFVGRALLVQELKASIVDRASGEDGKQAPHILLLALAHPDSLLASVR